MTNLHPLKYIVLLLLGILASQVVTAQTESELLQQLRADYYSLIDVMEEYELAGENYKMNASERDDYSNWINQLREQFTETCYAFSRQPNLQISPDIPCAEYASSYTSAVNIDIEHESTDGEKTAAIAGQFNEALGRFDEELLREQDRVKAMRPQNTSAQSGGGGGAGESGDGSSGDGESGEGEETGQPSDQQSGQQPGQRSDQQGRGQNDTGARGKPRPGNQADVPDDIPDGSDDDVVARQLREAAEMEADPVLRAKLWEEYRRYKNGQ